MSVTGRELTQPPGVAPGPGFRGGRRQQGGFCHLGVALLPHEGGRGGLSPVSWILGSSVPHSP